MPETALPIDKTSSSIWSGLKQKSFAPVDIASLVYFRIVFSAVMLWEVWRYFSHDWISRYWMEPTFHFTCWGFGRVQPWPGDGMYLHFYALGLLAVLVGLGLFYRVSATPALVPTRPRAGRCGCCELRLESSISMEGWPS